MSDKNNNSIRFNMNHYASTFEKTLLYSFSLVLATAIGVLYYSYYKQVELTYDKIQIVYLLMAALTTLPYFYLYALKNNYIWLEGMKDEENLCEEQIGLIKFFCLYEICLMTIFYLSIASEKENIIAKIFICVVSIIMLIFYISCGLFHARYKKHKNVSKEMIIICLSMIAFFICLILKNIHLRQNSSDALNNNILRSVIYVLTFLVNTIVNIIILLKANCSPQCGIVSNRIKIIDLVVSIVEYPIITTFCYYANLPMKVWIFIVCWLLFYQITISFSFDSNDKNEVKIISGFMISFIGIGIPFVLIKSWESENGLSLVWLILIGISVYMAALKYWGGIYRDTKYQSDDFIYEMMTRFNTCFLGSVIFTTILMVWSDSYIILTTVMIVIFVVINFFMKKKILDTTMNFELVMNDRKGRLIEYLGIALPIIGFFLDLFIDFRWSYIIPVVEDEAVQFIAIILIVYLCALCLVYIDYVNDIKKTETKLYHSVPVFEIQTKFGIIKVPVILNLSEEYLENSYLLFFKLVFYSFIIHILLCALVFFLLFLYKMTAIHFILYGIVIIVLFFINSCYVTKKLTKYFYERLRLR